MQIWNHGLASPRGLATIARATEEEGWDGLCVVDSQNLSGDPYVSLAMAATVTEKIGLGTAVTNSVTRVAAANAAGIASVDRIANGRAVLGIGRGDSALAPLGWAPARVAQFETYLRHLQAYLGGEPVPFEELQLPDDVAPPVGALGLAGHPTESRLTWVGNRHKVPVEVAATGPRLIAIAAVHAERVMFALGADPVRISWGIEVAREARAAAGLEPDGVRFGAYVNCVCHPDLNVARELIKGQLTTFARFSIMHGKSTGPTSDSMDRALRSLHAAYDMRSHTQSDSAQAATLTPEFIDYFGVVGSPERCIERFQPLAELGLDKILVAANFRLTQNESEAGETARRLMARELVPAVQAMS